MSSLHGTYSHPLSLQLNNMEKVDVKIDDDFNPIYPELVHNCTFQLHLSLERLMKWIVSNQALSKLLWGIY